MDTKGARGSRWYNCRVWNRGSEEREEEQEEEQVPYNRLCGDQELGLDNADNARGCGDARLRR
jgi:hypothetical protein